jgi:hypothetical protein
MHNVPYIAAIAKKGLLETVEGLFSNKTTYEAVMPFFVNGGKCGHKVMDVKGAVDALRDADTTGLLNNFMHNGKPVNDFRLGNVLKDVIRRRIKLGKDWKAVSASDKVAEENPEAAKHFNEYLIAISYTPTDE